MIHLMGNFRKPLASEENSQLMLSRRGMMIGAVTLLATPALARELGKSDDEQEPTQKSPADSLFACIGLMEKIIEEEVEHDYQEWMEQLSHKRTSIEDIEKAIKKYKQTLDDSMKTSSLQAGMKLTGDVASAINGLEYLVYEAVQYKDAEVKAFNDAETKKKKRQEDANAVKKFIYSAIDAIHNMEQKGTAASKAAAVEAVFQLNVNTKGGSFYSLTPESGGPAAASKDLFRTTCEGVQLLLEGQRGLEAEDLLASTSPYLSESRRLGGGIRSALRDFYPQDTFWRAGQVLYLIAPILIRYQEATARKPRIVKAIGLNMSSDPIIKANLNSFADALANL